MSQKWIERRRSITADTVFWQDDKRFVDIIENLKMVLESVDSNPMHNLALESLKGHI